jgi:hypothetical protein
MGVLPEIAELRARTCAASVSVWSVWNRLEANALGNSPIWCEGDRIQDTLPAVLAAGWDEKLFDEYFPDIPSDTDDIAAIQIRIEKLRDTAIKEFAKGKPVNIDELFKKVRRLYLVAQQPVRSPSTMASE